MFQIKDAGDAASSGRPSRSASRGGRVHPSALLGDDFAGVLKSFQNGSSFAQMMRAVDLREKVTEPYEQVPPLRACLKAIAQAVASLGPPVLYTGDPVKDKNAEEVTGEHPTFGGIARLLAEPNGTQTAAQFFEAGALHRKLDGEDFWFPFDREWKPIQPGQDGRFNLPFALLSVRGRAVTHQLNDFGAPRTWSFSFAGGKTIDADAKAVVHFRDYNPDDPIRGLGDVETLVADLDYWWQAYRYNTALLKNGGDPGGWIIDESGTQVGEEERVAMERDAEQKQNVRNAGKYRVLPRGLKYQPNAISPKDMNFTELMKFTRLAIAGATGVPLPVIADLEHATLANYAEAVRMFWEGGNGIVPYTRTVEDVLLHRFVRKLRIPGVEKLFVRFDLRQVKALREDTSKQWEIATRLTSLGMSLDEAMQLLGLEGDTSEMPMAAVGWIPSTVVPVKAVVDESGEPAGFDEEPVEGVDPAAAALPGATAVQDTALNGTQIASLLAILQLVSDGTLKPEGAIAVILSSFPTITEERAREMVAGVNEKPPEPDPASAPVGDSPAADPEAPAEDDPEPEKAGEPVTRDAEPHTADAAEAERRTYWSERASRLLDRAEGRVRRAYKGWRRRYERSQLARLRSIAAEARSAKKAADDGPLDQPPRWGQAEVDPLLLPFDKWVESLKAQMDPALRNVVSLALDDIAGDLGTDALPVDGGDLVQFLSRQTIQLAEGHMSTLANQVRDVLVEELSKSNSTSTVAQALAETLDSVEERLSETWADRVSRANTIARTETGRAVNHARTEQMRKDGVAQHEWVDSNDDAVRESHRALDGQVRALGAEFKPGLREPHDENAPPEEVINCFAAGTPVSGAFVAGSKALYAGPAREFKTSRGHRLTVTPNHPVLTTAGWKAARDLREGDHLIAQARDVGASVLRNPNRQDEPAPIEDVFEAVAAKGTVRLQVVGALDFHRDAQFFAPDVATVGADRSLGREPSESLEGREELALALPDPCPDRAEEDGARGQFSRSALLASASGVSSADLARDARGVGTHTGPLHALRIGPAADLDARCDELAKERGADDSKLIGELLQAGAGFVAADELVEVREVELRGHVYDLQSVTGWILAGGIVAGNCRCLTRPVVSNEE